MTEHRVDADGNRSGFRAPRPVSSLSRANRRSHATRPVAGLSRSIAAVLAATAALAFAAPSLAIRSPRLAAQDREQDRRQEKNNDQEKLFETKIRPILVDVCLRCHGDTKASGGLRVDSRDALVRGGESGAAIVPGDPERSLLLQAVRRAPDISAMPPDKDKALRPDQVADFAAWIKAGAVWPARTARFVAAKHWSFEPVREPSPPAVRDSAWLRTPVDSFIRARQEATQTTPAPTADKRSLIRRVSFDLLGLPPSPEDVDEFVGDAAPDAFARLVDRLLASPRHGEKWGRHWLDVVRYADTAGETADYPVPLAWRYRNYVIDAFNADKPYDLFLREQLAGDVLALRSSLDGSHDGVENRRSYAEQVTATGYLAISRRFGFDSENYHHLTIQDTIDTLGQSLLGLTLGCGRCHDHKFDPVSMRDYYALYGIFDSSRYPFPGSEQKQKVRAMAALVPPAQAAADATEHRRRMAALTSSLEALKLPTAAAVLRTLSEIDGDFELQAPAAGGSNGVLVPPWQYSGPIAVTTAAQSPFKNVYPGGRIGASIAAGTTSYKIEQALHPGFSSRRSERLFFNLDFRVGASEPLAAKSAPLVGHRIALGAVGSRVTSAKPGDAIACELLVTSDNLWIRRSDGVAVVAFKLIPNEWTNVQLELSLVDRTVTTRLGRPGSTLEFTAQPLNAEWRDTFDLIALESHSHPAAKLPAIEYDNVAVSDQPFAPAALQFDATNNTTKDSAAALAATGDVDVSKLNAELQQLIGIDGDLEGQPAEKPPVAPWNPGPNSAVKLTSAAQSPFHNHYPAGKLGLRMPNRGEYDGFGVTIPPAVVRPDEQGRLHIAFDFRCASQDAGGDGTWRYYIGHGAGPNPAIELFINGREFFRRSANDKSSVAKLEIGRWYQVQLALDLKGKTYRGKLLSTESQVEFSGDFAPGWDGTLDYSFIDSYGHIGGVRPALDADNFLISAAPLSPLNPQTPANPSTSTTPASPATTPPSPDAPKPPAQSAAAERQARIAALKEKLAALQATGEQLQREYESRLIAGSSPLTYGMSEGTPHPARIQLRGEPDRLGDEVPRGFIAALGGGSLPAGAQGSGRLELAEWLTRPDHPLTARVMANRIWQYHFGRGLVKTPNDFGSRGQAPTHPELLDYLAARFVKRDWSIKSLHREILLAATYRQGSFAPANVAAGNDRSADAPGLATRVSSDQGSNQNSNNSSNPSSSKSPGPSEKLTPTEASELYVGFARRRLSAEELRDAVLGVCDRLDLTPGAEHPFPPPTRWGYSQHGPFIAVYDHSRRSVYLMTQRLKRHPLLALFDGADPNASTAERLGTIVPTQALFFLNDPLVHGSADNWARRLSAQLADDGKRITAAWRSAVGRAPTQAELADAGEFLSTYRQELAAAGEPKDAAEVERRALAAYLRTLIGSNEFLYVD